MKRFSKLSVLFLLAAILTTSGFSQEDAASASGAGEKSDELTESNTDTLNPGNGFRVRSVSLDRNRRSLDSGEQSSKSTLKGSDPATCEEEIAELNRKIKQLEAERDARKARSELATGIATLKLQRIGEVSGPATLRLHQDDRFEIGNLRMVRANKGASVMWQPIDPAGKSEGTSPVPKSNTKSSAQGEVEQSSVFPVIKMLQEFNKSNPVPVSLPKTQHSESTEVSLENVTEIVYQQPAPEWQVFYELDGDCLSQWARIGNFSDYPWPAKTPIILLDVYSDTDNQRISFPLNAPLNRGQELIQQVFQTTVKKDGVDLSFQLGENGHPQAVLLLDENLRQYLPQGDFRATLQEASIIHQSASYSRKSGRLSIGPEYSIRIESPDWNGAMDSGEVLKVDGGIFIVRQERKIETQIKSTNASSPAKKVRLSKLADTENWDLVVSTDVGNNWELIERNDKSFYETDQPLNAKVPPLMQVSKDGNHLVLNFFDPTDKIALAKIVVANGDRPKTEAQLLLELVLQKAKDIETKTKSVARLSTEIAALEVRYDELEFDPTNVVRSKQALRGIKERIVRLDRDKMNLEKKLKRLRIEIHSDMFPALETPATETGFYSLVK